MDDLEIVARIGELTDEEHALECWDLLRQRRARRDAGDDPNRAAIRPEDVVEGYEQ